MPPAITLVSGNRHKFDEISKILSRHGIQLKWKQAGLEEKEGLSLEETAKEKAKQAFELVKEPVIGEDTGVFFGALGDFPGTKAKRVFEEIGFEGLLGKVEGKNRNARFETVICYTADGLSFKCFTGILRGSIDTRAHDLEKGVLPYEKIIIPDGYNRTLSSISRGEKNTFSHRAKAAEKLAEWLKGKG